MLQRNWDHLIEFEFEILRFSHDTQRSIHENIDFSDAPEAEIPEEFMEVVEARKKSGKKEYGFNAPVGRWETPSRM